MTLAKTTLMTTLALAALAFTTKSADADTYDHIDHLAVKMQAQSRELLKEFALHYRHKSGYFHLRSDAIQLNRRAAHIHSVAHHAGSVHHLRDDLRRMDRLFHHLESVLAQTDLSFGGHAHGDTHHVFEVMHDLEVNLHHLKRDIDELDNAAHHGVGPHNVGHGAPHHGGHIGNAAHGYSWGNGGLYIGGHRWSLRFGH
jgi:hypothetical protein